MKNRAFPTLGYNPATGQWNDSLAADYLWCNVNVAEAVPDVMTPSTWSLWWIFHVETNPFQFPGEPTVCGNICGRPYLNISLLYSAYQALGRDARKQLEGGITASTPYNVDIPAIPFSRRAVVAALVPGVLRAHLQAARDRRALPAFLRRMPAWCRTTRQAIGQLDDSAPLLLLWESSLRPAVVRACRMLRSATMSLSEPATELQKHLSALVGEDETSALLSGVSGASASLESLGPLLCLARLRDGLMTRAEYIERYGHRGPHEMELYAAGLDEDPGLLDLALEGASASTADLEARLARQQNEQAAAWQRFQARDPRPAAATRRALDRIARLAREREAVRSEVTRLARLVRCFLLRAGQRTGLGDGVFFLALDETTALLHGDRSATLYIPARRKAYLQVAALPPYPSIIVGAFDPLRWVADPKRRSDFFDSRQAAPATSARVQGMAGSAGCAEGLVRRIDRVEEAQQVLPGEILVTTTTNIGWTPIFPRLAAIVTDVGAPLSHAAIVAREVGIPAVVGCGNASMLLRTGMRVRVDGGLGTVEILAQPEAV